MNELQELKRATQELKSALRKLDGSEDQKGLIQNVDDVIDKFDSVLNENILSKLKIIADSLDRLDGKAVHEIQSYMDTIKINFDIDKFEDNVVDKVTYKIGTVKFNRNLTRLNNDFVETIDSVITNLNDTKDHFDDLTLIVSKLPAKLENLNLKIIDKIGDSNNSIENINNWLFVGGIALGGLTVGLFNLLRSI